MDSKPSSVHAQFRHSPLLPEPSIRLLRITRNTPKSLAITLDAFPLDKLPEYEALSYTWGKATLDDDVGNDLGISQAITINSAPFTITENLYDGLCE
jgi:Heterokaryon incompatibility protein (HET)